MKVISNDASPATGQESRVREMTGLRLLGSRIYYAGARFRRRWVPYLVWHRDEVDVVVTFSQDTLDPANPFGALFSGGLFEIEKQLRNMGIKFDTGMGFDGRDWEWDWSLSGPISVRFRSRASKPELRRERPKPQLVVSTGTP